MMQQVILYSLILFQVFHLYIDFFFGNIRTFALDWLWMLIIIIVSFSLSYHEFKVWILLLIDINFFDLILFLCVSRRIQTPL